MQYSTRDIRAYFPTAYIVYLSFTYPSKDTSGVVALKQFIHNLILQPYDSSCSSCSSATPHIYDAQFIHQTTASYVTSQHHHQQRPKVNKNMHTVAKTNIHGKLRTVCEHPIEMANTSVQALLFF